MRLIALLVALALPATALAHHGWSWTTGGNIDLRGTIRSASLGLPHGRVEVAAEEETWTVEVGQPWRNERAGLTEASFAPGTEIRVIGEPSADPAEKRMKAERIYIGGVEHVLYPDRD